MLPKLPIEKLTELVTATVQEFMTTVFFFFCIYVYTDEIYSGIVVLTIELYTCLAKGGYVLGSVGHTVFCLSVCLLVSNFTCTMKTLVNFGGNLELCR